MDDLQISAKRRVARFVAALNSSKRERLDRANIPALCRVPAPDDAGGCDWRIVPVPEAGWLPALEARLPYPLPPTFRVLISSYVFPSFECGPLTFYSVGAEEPDQDTEFQFAVLRDWTMNGVLWQHGRLPFARPADWSYDPVCFDCRHLSPSIEPAVVRIDHEQILCHGRIRVISLLASAFDQLVEGMTADLLTNARGS
jgi:hypothetical protein